MKTIRLSGRANNLAGQPFDRLTAKRPVKRNKQGIWWECQCKCGNVVVVPAGRLRSRWTRSCGCLKSDETVAFNKSRRLSDAEAATREMFQRMRQAARRRGLVWYLDLPLFSRLVTSQCAYCGAAPYRYYTGQYGAKVLYNGIDRKDNTVGYKLGNVVSCCKTCNVAKNNLPYDEWLAWAKRLSAHLVVTNGWSRKDAVGRCTGQAR